MMIVVRRHDRMGKFIAPLSITVLGWAATFIMASAAIAMVVVQ